MSLKSADLYDRFESQVQVCDPIFRDFGGRRCFHGPVATVKCFEDNSLVKQALETEGAGRVLVVDAGGSLRCAMLGDLLAAKACANGWAGLILNGCVRDSVELGGMDLGVKALATHPRKSVRRGEGIADGAVQFAGAVFVPGSWVYCDEDGILVSPSQLL